MNKDIFLRLSLMIAFGLSIGAGYNLMEKDILTQRNYDSIHERINQSVNGVYFPSGTYCIHLNRKNVDGLYQTMDHELLHELIHNNHNCGNETCKEHFCGESWKE